MAGNAWAIVLKNDEDDATTDFVLSTDEQTFLPVGADIPNPEWVDDGNQTTPDANNKTRYLPYDVNNWNGAQIYLDGAWDVEDVRLEKADYQKSNAQYNVEMQRVQVTIAPA